MAGLEGVGTEAAVTGLATLTGMATLRLFASLREEAGERTVTLDGGTVGEVVSQANDKFGNHFAELASTCRIWVNGEPADAETAIGPGDEVALLPPVSGG